MFTSSIGAPITARTPAQLAATYQSITVTPASPHIGAVVTDIDLTQALSERQIDEVKDAFTRYQVLFFRNQKISFEDQIRFAGLFGPLGKHVGAQTISKSTDHPLVRKFHYDETSKRISGESWHSDQSCAPCHPWAACSTTTPSRPMAAALQPQARDSSARSPRARALASSRASRASANSSASS
jgi:hypothetical protein